MREGRAPPRRAGQEIARLEERQVERPPVERDQLPRVRDGRPHGVQEGGLGTEVAQEVLGHGERRGAVHVARPTRKTYVPVPPASPVVSVSRKTVPGPAPRRARSPAGTRTVSTCRSAGPWGVGTDSSGKGSAGGAGRSAALARRSRWRQRAELRQLGIASDDAPASRPGPTGGRVSGGSGVSRRDGRGARRPSASPGARPRSPGRRRTGSRRGTGRPRSVSRARTRSGPIRSNSRSVRPTPPGWLS